MEVPLSNLITHATFLIRVAGTDDSSYLPGSMGFFLLSAGIRLQAILHLGEVI